MVEASVVSETFPYFICLRFRFFFVAAPFPFVRLSALRGTLNGDFDGLWFSAVAARGEERGA